MIDGSGDQMGGGWVARSTHSGGAIVKRFGRDGRTEGSEKYHTKAIFSCICICRGELGGGLFPWPGVRRHNYLLVSRYWRAFGGGYGKVLLCL